jgi:hypothetical protein
MKSSITPSTLSLLIEWQKSDKAFFRKYRKDKKAMEIIAALAELIATYDEKSKSPLFYC